MIYAIEVPDQMMLEYWASFREHVAAHFPDLTPLVDAVAAHHELFSLFPFVSVGRLCFSRCTQYPYDVDFLISKVTASYVAEVTLDDGGWVHTERVGEGSAAEATAIVASLVPERYGSARFGTAGDLPPSPMRVGRPHRPT